MRPAQTSVAGWVYGSTPIAHDYSRACHSSNPDKRRACGR